MKRIVLLVLICCALLCACRKKPVETEPTTDPSTEATTEAAEPTQETTQATEPSGRYAHPLTGERLNKPWEGQVATIVINNIQDALPQHGVSQADMIYEIETEGGITRMLALFSHFADVEAIGPVRSDRSFFNNVSASFGAPILHCGGSQYGLNGQYDDTGAKVPGWKHIDAAYYEGTYFYRDKDRYNNQGYLWEHTLFTNGQLVQAALEKKNMYNPTSREFGLSFAEKPQLKGDTANQVKVNFRGGKSSSFAYNKKTGLYEMSQYGKEHIDANTGEQMAFRNVLVVYADQWFVYDGWYNRSFYDLLGEGKGLAAIDGKIVEITWHREKLEDPFTYTLEDGTQLTLGVGKTYVAVASPKKPATFE